MRGRTQDRLKPLMRLRTLEVAEARRDLAERVAGAERAALLVRTTAEAIRSEASEAGGDPALSAAYAAWLPVGRAAERRALGDQLLAETATEAARQALAAARVRERAVEWLRERAALEARLEAARREQAGIDEAASRKTAMRVSRKA
jgi:flagellar export protein FliJ